MTENTEPPTGRLDHVGIVVGDLATARRFLEDVLGLTCVREASLDEPRLDIAFFQCGEAMLELIEVHDPDARRERLGSGPARIEHIAIEVPDVDAAIGRLRGLGVRTTADAPLETAGARSYWTLPDTTAGVAYQFLER
jgi:catechol 2,3-dioxygenase-like lactoylglutathione lyase family enzyme